jgi:hypothetical protein
VLFQFAFVGRNHPSIRSRGAGASISTPFVARLHCFDLHKCVCTVCMLHVLAITTTLRQSKH